MPVTYILKAQLKSLLNIYIFKSNLIPVPFYFIDYASYDMSKICVMIV